MRRNVPLFVRGVNQRFEVDHRLCSQSESRFGQADDSKHSRGGSVFKFLHHGHHPFPSLESPQPFWLSLLPTVTRGFRDPAINGFSTCRAPMGGAAEPGCAHACQCSRSKQGLKVDHRSFPQRKPRFEQAESDVKTKTKVEERQYLQILAPRSFSLPHLNHPNPSGCPSSLLTCEPSPTKLSIQTRSAGLSLSLSLSLPPSLSLPLSLPLSSSPSLSLPPLSLPPISLSLSLSLSLSRTHTHTHTTTPTHSTDLILTTSCRNRFTSLCVFRCACTRCVSPAHRRAPSVRTRQWEGSVLPRGGAPGFSRVSTVLWEVSTMC